MIRVEVCINADVGEQLTPSVRAAQLGGAASVELCGGMHHQGLTPDLPSVRAARQALDRTQLLVMLRPRPGDFAYTPRDVALMEAQLADIAHTGADGVVFGSLRSGDSRFDRDAMGRLLRQAHQAGLSATVHRAFDATPDPLESLDLIVQLGFDRLLTSGTPWATGQSALDGVTTLSALVRRAAGQIEIVVGGGINPANAPQLLAALPLVGSRLTLHAYSGVQFNGITSQALVRSLCDAVEPWSTDPRRNELDNWRT
jgi:copper homeostasis protein